MQADLDLSDDAVLGGRLRLLQPRRGHRFGHDAILLAAAVAARTGERALDLGAGVGAAGLALAERVPGVSVALVEIAPELAALAAENARRNGLADRVTTHCLDVAWSGAAFTAAGLPASAFDHVLINPPFNDPARHNASPDQLRRAAHVGDALAPWLDTARRLLRQQGCLNLIYRADALADVLRALDYGFGAITILPIFPRPDAPAIRVLLRARKGARGALALEPGLVLNDAGGPTTAAEAILRDGGAFSKWESTKS